ncbi:MAG: hypothetical protein D6820_15675, partial [Lentisphaerae bacterium]
MSLKTVKLMTVLGMILCWQHHMLLTEEWKLDTPEEWRKNAKTSKNLLFDKKGMAVPQGKTAFYSSKLVQFAGKRKVKSITITQSPVWENWNHIKKVIPVCLGDAPVMLALGPKNYWAFGRYKRAVRAGKKGPVRYSWTGFKPKPVKLEGFSIPLRTTPFPNVYDAPGGLKQGEPGAYHAWQSRDMIHWVHHGPVTRLPGRWTTTAEYANGKIFLYYDWPNDQDPHLVIETVQSLTDGLPGKEKGCVFKDPTHGSDCAVIRDLDGKFHMISEDWTPINAQRHAWDSPLALHAVSPDGIKPFKIVKPPPVDQRTKPTGKFGTYKHPFWTKEDPKNFPSSVAKYEIHEPEQNAYGDWAAICVGGQYYLFCDFDPAGKTGGKNM